jgi:hypothetical protein
MRGSYRLVLYRQLLTSILGFNHVVQEKPNMNLTSLKDVSCIDTTSINF